MNRLIITTVGTSLFSKDKLKGIADRINQIPFTVLQMLHEEGIKENALYKQAMTYLNTIDKKEVKKFKEYSAEVASISLVEEFNKEQDKLVLLSSDTKDGALAARVNYDFILSTFFNIHEHYNKKMELVLVDDLQVDDVNKFKIGLSKLKDNITKINYANSAYKVKIMNITGGFKVTIPYLTIIAWSLGFEINYLFETGDTLIKLNKPDNFNVSIDDLIKSTQYYTRRTGQAGALG